MGAIAAWVTGVIGAGVKIIAGGFTGAGAAAGAVAEIQGAIPTIVTKKVVGCVLTCARCGVACIFGAVNIVVTGGKTDAAVAGDAEFYRADVSVIAASFTRTGRLRKRVRSDSQ